MGAPEKLDLSADAAKPVLAKYTAALPDTYVAYTGSGMMKNANDYVCIDGPGVWIEYSVQPSRDIPGTTHAHAVGCNHVTDFGGK